MDTPISVDQPDETHQLPAAAARRRTLRSRLLNILFVVGGLAVLAAGIGFRFGDLHAQTVLSGSMRPAVSPGDLAITQGVPVSSLGIGDVIVFTPPNETQPVLHRIASRQGDVLTTRGDANGVEDPWRIRPQGTTAYRLVFVVPYIGHLTGLRGPALIAAGLIVGLLILLEIRKGVGGRTAQAAS